MRRLALPFRIVIVLGLGGCPTKQGDTCTVDADCGGLVCARDGECLPASDLYPVKVTWTIRGMAANATTCAPAPDFYVYFLARTQESFGFAPVPCDQGQFFVDKLPRRFIEVEVGADNRFDNTAAIMQTSGNATATFDLFP